MIPMIDDFKQSFNLGKDFVVVADSGLMNKNNVTLLQEAGYNYILGVRIKSESASVKQWILSLEKVDKACYDYKRENGERHFYKDIDVWELYDLQTDPNELHNLYGQPGMEKVTKQLMKRLKQLQIQYDDPILEKYPIK